MLNLASGLQDVESNKAVQDLNEQRFGLDQQIAETNRKYHEGLLDYNEARIENERLRMEKTEADKALSKLKEEMEFGALVNALSGEFGDDVKNEALRNLIGLQKQGTELLESPSGALEFVPEVSGAKLEGYKKPVVREQVEDISARVGATETAKNKAYFESSPKFDEDVMKRIRETSFQFKSGITPIPAELVAMEAKRAYENSGFDEYKNVEIFQNPNDPSEYHVVAKVGGKYKLLRRYRDAPKQTP